MSQEKTESELIQEHMYAQLQQIADNINAIRHLPAFGSITSIIERLMIEVKDECIKAQTLEALRAYQTMYGLLDYLLNALAHETQPQPESAELTTDPE